MHRDSKKHKANVKAGGKKGKKARSAGASSEGSQQEEAAKSAAKNLLGPLPDPDDPAERNKRQKRAGRFEANSRARELNEGPSAAQHDRWAAGTAMRGQLQRRDTATGDIELDYTVQGTCTVVEKKYLRLTSAPDPRTVRPEPVLKRAIEWIRERMQGFDPAQQQANYIFLWEQLKSVRQDLTVQRIRNAFTVEVYEMHARVCLEYDDQAELKQCQAQLEVLYEEGLGTEKSRREFKAYQILYNVGKRASQNLVDELASLTAEDRSSPFIVHALRVRAAAALDNYFALFQLYAQAPGHAGFVMDTFIEAERFAALQTICRAYSPHVPTIIAARHLGFDTAEECGEWATDHGAKLSADGDRLACKESTGSLVSHSIRDLLEEQRKEEVRRRERVPITF